MDLKESTWIYARAFFCKVLHSLQGNCDPKKLKERQQHCSLSSGDNDTKGARLKVGNLVTIFIASTILKRKNENQLGDYCSNQCEP